MKTLHSLRTSGIQIRTPVGLSTIRAKFVTEIFDLPAKASALCVKQYHGKYGCTVCEHPGKQLPNRANVYLPDTYPMRTHASVLAAAKEAEQNGAPVLGVKGLPPLRYTLDLTASIPVDYMPFLREQQVVNKCLVSVRKSSTAILLRTLLNSDTIFLQQRPQEFSRPPRSVRKQLAYWKASEFRMWLFHYLLPILLNYLPSLYLHHYALLVCAMHILPKDCISRVNGS